MKMSASLKKQEIIAGSLYGVFQFLMLPSIALFLNYFIKMPEWVLQVAVFGVNFLCTILIFHRFLFASCKSAIAAPLKVIGFTLLGLMLYYVGNLAVSFLIFTIRPDYLNLNDASISLMADEGGLWIALSTVLLVPVAEECLFRGLLFRGFYDRSPAFAWILSVCSFSAVHILGYIGLYDGVELFLAFLQYLPAGLCLSFAYKASGTILSPILMHTLINAVGMIVLI